MKKATACGVLAFLNFLGAQNMAAFEEGSHFLIRGTLNVVLANSNGFVVVTDSMQTAVRGTEMYQLSEPGQKLFRLDDRTVCTIAGFGSGKVPTAPEFNTSAAAVIERYMSELTAQPRPVPFREKLTSLSFLFNFYISSFANIRDTVQGGIPPGQYEFQLILAGYDTDGTPKLGRFSLRTVIGLGRDAQPVFSSFTEHIMERSVNQELLIETAGQDDVARETLGNPERFTNDPAIRRYIESMRKSRGTSMTEPDMRQLAEALVRQTERRHPTVGGPRQVAILEQGRITALELPRFRLPTSSMLSFNLVTGGHFEGPRTIALGNSIGLFVRNYFRRDVRTLDGHYFFGNQFVESQLRYDGGVTRFDPSNRIINCVLIIGPDADPNSEFVRSLVNSFPWTAVRFEEKQDNVRR